MLSYCMAKCLLTARLVLAKVVMVAHVNVKDFPHVVSMACELVDVIV